MEATNYLKSLIDLLPAEALKLILTLFLSFLIGLEREEHKGDAPVKTFGGVRTFPLIGLLGFAMALISGPQLWPLFLGFITVGAFLLVSYYRKLISGAGTGITTEMSGLMTFLLGALIQYGYFWIATTIAVTSVFLLEMKEALQRLSKNIASQEIATFTQFLIMTAVILPIVPDQDFTEFNINPFKTWLLVVAVSTISYGSYLLQKLTQSRGSVLLTAVLGGSYASTATTVALARKSKADGQIRIYSGGVVLASAMVYLRLALFLLLFNDALFTRLVPTIAILALVAIGTGIFWARSEADYQTASAAQAAPQNPIELRSALLFAFVFLVMKVVAQATMAHLGPKGIYALGALMGVADIDPFVLALIQSPSSVTPEQIAIAGILTAAAANNFLKGIYSYIFGSKSMGRQALTFLFALGVLGLLPLFFL